MELSVLDRIKPFKRLQSGLFVREDTQVQVKSHLRRGQSGQQERVRQYVRVLHGTRAEVADRILAKGILPGRALNYTNWDYHPGDLRRRGGGSGDRKVFVATKKELAIRFGKVASHDQPFVVIEAMVPEDELKVDTRVEGKPGDSPQSFRLNFVRPEWIKKMHFYEVGGHTGRPDLENRVLHKRTVKIADQVVRLRRVFIPVPVDSPLVTGLIHEATTTVKQHTSHSKSGKAFTVKQHEREVPTKLSGPITDADRASYHYHATNLDNARDIAAHGLQPHKPDYGTDQKAWPDGSTEKRSYFGTPEAVWSFAPEHGYPVVLRVRRDATRFKRESTGDVYARNTIRAKHIEILTSKGWQSLSTTLHEATADVDAYTRVVNGKPVQVRRHNREYEKGMEIIRAHPRHGYKLHPSIVKLKHRARLVKEPEKAKTSDTIMSGEVNLTADEMTERQKHIDFLGKASSVWLRKNVPSGKPDMKDLAMLSKHLGQKYGHRVDAITKLMEDRTKYLNRPAVFVPIPNGPSLYILGWRDRPADIEGTEIHDHASSQAGVYVHKGVVTERLFGVSKEQFGGEQLDFKAIDRDLYQGGTISVIAPYVHEVYDKSDQNFSVTIHSYYPPLKEMSFYRVKGDKLLKSGHWKEDDPANAPAKEWVEARVRSHTRHSKKGKAFTVRSITEATTQVKAHTARSRLGKIFTVRQHARSYQAAQNMKVIGATPTEAKHIREALSKHDPRVTQAVPFIKVLKRKDFMKLVNKGSPEGYEADGTEVGWYDEGRGYIALNHSELVSPFELIETLHHEMGHAAYFHSRKLDDWVRVHHLDKKFDRHTPYSKVSVSEAFAEAYMAYTYANGKARSPKYKKTFNVVNRVLSAVNPKVNQFKVNPLFKPLPD